MSDNPFNMLPHVEGKSADELLRYLLESGAQPGSPVQAAVLTALQVQIAEMQRDTARDAVTWAKVQGVATLGATIIALVALLIAAL